MSIHVGERSPLVSDDDVIHDDESSLVVSTPALFENSNEKGSEITKEKLGNESERNSTKLISNALSILFNLINTTVGSGILALPFAFREAGLVLGPILLFIVSILSCYTLFILLSSAKETNCFTYKELAEKMFPWKITGYIFEIVIFLFCFGALVGYCVILGQFLEIQMSRFLLYYFKGFETGWTVFLSNRALLTGIPMVFIIFPLCLLHKIHFLSYSSLLSILSALFVVFVILARSIQVLIQGEIGNGPIKLVGSPTSIFVAFPILCYSMASHITLLPMYSNMKKYSINIMRGVCGISTIICFLLYLITGIFGYLQFRDITLDNILNNFHTDDILATSAKVIISVVVVLSYPLLHFACRESLENVLFPDKPFSNIRWVAEAAIICALTFTIASLVPKLQIVFGVVGATTGTLVVYIFPALIYFRLAKSWLYKTIALIVIVLSLIMGCISTVVLILDEFEMILV
jgi:amino acid permease